MSARGRRAVGWLHTKDRKVEVLEGLPQVAEAGQSGQEILPYDQIVEPGIDVPGQINRLDLGPDLSATRNDFWMAMTWDV